MKSSSSKAPTGPTGLTGPADPARAGRGRARPTRGRVVALALAALVGGAAPLLAAGTAVAARPAFGEAMRAVRALEQGRMEDARARVAELVRTAPDDGETRFVQANLAFLEGDYERARALLEKLDDPRLRSLRDELLPLVVSTAEATQGFARREFPHFVVLYPPGKDEHIVELAGEALEAAYARIGADLGYFPPDKVRVEILERPSDLARVSPLTVKEIETSGTIALAKYNKLMIVSPRATVFGYPWMDTLAHEYTHFVVSRLSKERVPVWLHEGLAKFEETRWRAEPGAERLPRHMEQLLLQAIRRRRLVTFEEMHPSMAKLPSAELAATAFAEVYTMVAWIHREKGYEGIRAAIAKIAEGKSERRALGEVMGRPWAKVEADWRRHLKTLDLRGGPRAKGAGKIRFKRGADEAGDETAGLDLVNDKARKFARLGGMLRARRRFAAAAAEYEKAHALTGPDEPFVAGKLARTYLDMGAPEKAIAVAEPLAARAEDDALPHATLGAAYLAVGQLAKAEPHLLAAVRISPFDPAVRCGLAVVYEQAGDAARATREGAACDALGGTRPGAGKARRPAGAVDPTAEPPATDPGGTIWRNTGKDR